MCDDILGRVKPYNERPPKEVAEALAQANDAYRKWRASEVLSRGEEEKGSLQQAWRRAKDHYDHLLWKNRVQGAKEKRELMNDEDKKLA